ncbi:hypothetical protein [Pleurocapsa sp. PCC 7319]|uniref:hypothetical protein n=1 Tax=Pleurocapsa sp. PCC 7319 TaxID=118161 RepID=UPI0003493D64|nr:hypothetical protein [Pleurocapsa sp. PCC 7319]
MTEITPDLSLDQALSLIDSYGFDLGGDDAEKLLKYWLDLYHASWIRLATIEALYLGRYKAISIEHILSVWLRLGSPNTHFTYEFERVICQRLPKHLNSISNFNSSPTKVSEISLSQQDFPKNQSNIPVKSSRERKENRQAVIVRQNNKVLKSEISNPAIIPPKPDYLEQPKVSLVSALGLRYQANWSELSEEQKTIHQFIPLPDVSSFFNKLKAFGEEKLEG